MHKTLFLCVHNSTRSQMAEAFLKQFGNGEFEAESAGLKMGKLNPYVVGVMQEAGIDISQNKTKEVFDLFKQGRFYHAVIAVCDEKALERCPIFLGICKRIAWSFSDLSAFRGSEEEILEQTRIVRDQIKEKVTQFISEASAIKFWID